MEYMVHMHIYIHAGERKKPTSCILLTEMEALAAWLMDRGRRMRGDLSTANSAREVKAFPGVCA